MATHVQALHERLQILDGMTEIPKRFRRMRETGKFSIDQTASTAAEDRP